MRRPVLAVVLIAVLAFLALPGAAGAYVFWTSPTGAVGRVGNDGGDPRPALIPAGAETAPIAVDAEHLYYAPDGEDEAGGDLIARTDLDGAAGALLPEGSLTFTSTGPTRNPNSSPSSPPPRRGCDAAARRSSPRS